MKKYYIFALSILTITLTTACSGNQKQQKTETNVETVNADSIQKAKEDSLLQKQQADSIEQARKDSIALAEKEKAEAAANDQLAIQKIKSMYNSSSYNNDSYLAANCTKKLLRKLRANYEYECESGACYASWLFRSGAQDGPSERQEIISVTPLGNSWYRYDFYDMGTKGANKIKVIKQGGKLKFDDVVKIF